MSPAKTMFELANEISSKVQEEMDSRVLLDYAKITLEPKLFRILMPEGGNSIAIYGEHFVVFQSGKKRSFSCPKYTDDTADCLICDSAKGPGQPIQDKSLSKKFLVYAIDREDENKIKKLKLGPMLWNSIAVFARTPEELEAKDLNISQVRNGRGVEYIVTPVKKATPLTDEEDEAIAKLPSVSEAIPSYNEDTIKTLMVETAENSIAPVNGTATEASRSKLQALLNKTDEDTESDEVPSSTLQSLIKKPTTGSAEESEGFFASLKKRNQA